ncbi:hypothetical protein MHC_03200 [Mycoplasma haemocanis str. Illinois]|uniref:Uncharacterized protein n=1 Tax=Mycoplasma haemocanis (strain Illinois) TaxID=1111676 RepID=H6N778_MYCHN|nr:hypothetical protein [Mycoplasma haemocanis]AEW45500.1 hypothetical protein MHC_03200 [Mycoplasma haemocanis str. Illinois]
MAIKYLITGLAASGGVASAVGLYIMHNNKRSTEKKVVSFAEYLKEKGKTILDTQNATHTKEWEEKKTSYNTAQDGELITKIQGSQETTIQKGTTITVEDLKGWCGKKASSTFSSEDDSEYKKFFKWCIKENE